MRGRCAIARCRASAKFERAQKLHLLAGIDFDVIKADELVALTALELALQEPYAGVLKERRKKATAVPPRHPYLTGSIKCS
jgi:hypothetical protein